MKAIVSVFDKTGVVDLGRRLSEIGFEIYSTGGTKQVLKEAGITVHSISELTGFPEILDGRVKTLHPAVHGGILARRDVPSHMEQLSKQGISPIDLVVVNLYPFVQTISRPGVTLQDALENIDIGGPTMIRAAAKNFPSVVVMVDPRDYDEVLGQWAAEGNVKPDLRQRLAARAYQHTATYDTYISRYLRGEGDQFPENQTIALQKVQDLRYGENPHQSAALYREELAHFPAARAIVQARQLQGKELSFNNILDADAALQVAADFDEPTVAIIKHTNPCGLASHTDLVVAYKEALAGDPAAAFGGIVAVNRTIDEGLAAEMASTFYEIVVAPAYTDGALGILKARQNLRLLKVSFDAPDGSVMSRLDWKRVSGGFLAQTSDTVNEDKPGEFRVVTKRRPTDKEMADLLFAWRAVRHIKSNAITVCKDRALLGMGAGQPSRVESVLLALKKANGRAGGAALGSDAYFPFPDGIIEAAKGGVKSIIQPGGSMRDDEAIRAADEHGVAMVFTGRRHFKH